MTIVTGISELIPLFLAIQSVRGLETNLRRKFDICVVLGSCRIMYVFYRPHKSHKPSQFLSPPLNNHKTNSPSQAPNHLHPLHPLLPHLHPIRRPQPLLHHLPHLPTNPRRHLLPLPLHPRPPQLRLKLQQRRPRRHSRRHRRRRHRRLQRRAPTHHKLTPLSPRRTGPYPPPQRAQPHQQTRPRHRQWE